jgi:hypothetical protein
MKNLEKELTNYFAKNKLAGLNSVFVKFGPSMAVLKVLSSLIRTGKLVESGEMTYKVYRWRD